MSTIRIKIITAALAVVTAISAPAAIAGGVAAHRADERATASEARAADAGRAEEILDSIIWDRAILDRVTPEPSFGDPVWWGAAEDYAPTDIESEDQGGSRGRWHWCPGGVVAQADRELLEDAGVTVRPHPAGLGEGFVMPTVLDVYGVQCDPAAE